MKTTKKFSKIVHHNVERVSDDKYVIFSHRNGSKNEVYGERTNGNVLSRMAFARSVSICVVEGKRRMYAAKNFYKKKPQLTRIKNRYT
jgi:hypothetical protein